jgi:hypothetical protein
MDPAETVTETPSEQAFRLLGGAPGIKRRFNISLQAAGKWKKLIPPDRCVAVSDITGVDLRALLTQNKPDQVEPCTALSLPPP